MKSLTLFQFLRNILSRLTKKKVSLNSYDTPQDWRRGELVGICVGHSRIGDRGAVNHNGTVDEWSYNLLVGRALKRTLAAKGVRSILYSTYEGGSYRSAMNFIGDKLKEDGATLALELHFNASSEGVARGSETWYRYGAPKGRRLAQFIQSAITNSYGTRDRGVKAATRGTRGFNFMKDSSLPKVLVEPFFGDNKYDYVLFSKPDELGQPLADGIYNFLLDKHTSNQSARKDNAVE